MNIDAEGNIDFRACEKISAKQIDIRFANDICCAVDMYYTRYALRRKTEKRITKNKSN